LLTSLIYLTARTDPLNDVSCYLVVRVDTDDLIDTQGVAEILGLAYRNTVLQYQQRYGDMPRPVFDLGKGRVKLWLRSEITAWSDQQAASGRTRSARRGPR